MHVEEILYFLSLCSTVVSEDLANLFKEGIREVRMYVRVCMSDDCEVDAK